MNIENGKDKLERKIKRFDAQIAFLQKLKAQHLARIHALNSEQKISSPLPSHHNQTQDNILWCSHAVGSDIS
ncbi:MAG: hypothetical protein H8D23_21475 [Candidatus Brocadiales bacterium]|nr:hypothetical protein [Candidatus Brocadiales bacterium]